MGSGLELLLEKDIAAENFGAARGREVFIERVERKAPDNRLVRVSNNLFDAGHCGKFVRRPLGIAAGDDDAGFRTARCDSANQVANFAVGFVGNGAGIYNDNAGVVGCRRDRGSASRSSS